jgi:plastocyanin
MSVTSVVDDFTLANRGAVSAGGTTSGVLEFNNDSDIFAITVTAGQTIEFFADAAFRYDLNIRGAADNDFLAYSNSLVTNRPLTYTFGAAGTYYVSLSGG